MDDDIFSDLSVVNAKKTYKPKKPALRYSSDYDKDINYVEKPQPLTTKVAIKFLLEGRLKSKVCRYCLNVTPGLSELDQIMKIGGTGNLYKVTIRDIVASFHPFKVVEDPNFPNKICQKCLDKALSAYLFTQQCERAERAMLNCFDDMYEKFEKLDPIDRPKKRGRQKQNPNYNILHAEHYKVIDYAEPIINIINIGAETVTNEPELNELECKKCWQVLPNLESLLNHEKVHPKTMWYHCRLCGKSFPKRNQLKKHNHRVHVLGKEIKPNVDKDFKCKECDHVTENFVQHLQHIEKHKFRNLMEHLIEKKMDTLCVVCFNKGSRLNELDKMVCIHGGHPDLMGDKTLYHVLASTLPNPKSYKYQELYIPSRAQIMTISKRPHSYCDASIKKINPLVFNDDHKDKFIFSKPVVVTNNRFKTDHFYFYVFCDPGNQITSDIMRDYCISAIKIENLCVSKPTKLVEVVEIDEIVDDIRPKKAKMSQPTPSTTKDTMATNEISAEFANWATQTAICTKGINKQINLFKAQENIMIEEINQEYEMPTKRNKVTDDNDKPFYFEIIKQNLTNKPVIKDNIYFTFSNPDLVYKKYKDDTDRKGFKNINAKNIKNAKTRDALSKPENILSHSESRNLGNEKTAKMLTQDLCDKCWVFKKTCEVCKSCDNIAVNKTLDLGPVKATECTYCWVFKQIEKCEYCKKNIGKVDGPEKVETNKEFKNNSEEVKASIVKTKWQCSVCLTNNSPDRITCYCCGTIKITEYTDIKFPFGNNPIFFQTKDNAKYEVTETVDEKYEYDTADTGKDKSDKLRFIEESTMMDFKSNSDDATDNSTINMMTMDIESNAVFNIKEVENMEVEENPITSNKGVDWTEAPMFRFNINNNITNPVSDNIPRVATLQFNIGCTAEPKAQPRKFKKVLRNIPKALNK